MLLGINSDEDREKLKAVIESEKISWRSWWDAGSKDGPIQTMWQVEERPAIYLLDAEGVIRHKHLDEEELEVALEELLNEKKGSLPIK